MQKGNYEINRKLRNHDMIKIDEHGSPRVVYGESGYLTETLWEICGTGSKKDFSKRYF